MELLHPVFISLNNLLQLQFNEAKFNCWIYNPENVEPRINMQT